VIHDLDALNRALADAGFVAMSPWWRDTLSSFYASTKRQLVLRVGRRGGKSSSLCRVGVLEALYGDHVIPRGDVGYVAFLSVDRNEAARRIVTIRAILDALRVPYTASGDEIRLTQRPIVFAVMTASLTGVVGGTVIAAFCDEVASWYDRDTGANPAREVLEALRPSMATMPNARMFLSSSPWSTDDAHARAFERGETDFQSIAFAETWIANPTLTEAKCRALAESEREFRRAYAAIPAPLLLEGYFNDVLEGCVDVDRDGPSCPIANVPYVVTIDPATRRDGWAIAVTRAEERPQAEPIAYVEHAEVLTPRPNAPLIVSDAVMHTVGVARRFGCTHVWGDQAMADALRPLFAQQGIEYADRPWTAANKRTLFRAMHMSMSDRRVRLPGGVREVARQFAGVAVRMMPGGHESFQGARGVPDDLCSAIVMGVDLAMLSPGPRPSDSAAAERFATRGREADAVVQRWSKRNWPISNGQALSSYDAEEFDQCEGLEREIATHSRERERRQ
jgi:hypothetical protein